MATKEGSKNVAVTEAVLERCDAHCVTLGPGWTRTSFVQAAVEQFLALIDTDRRKRKVPKLILRIDAIKDAEAASIPLGEDSAERPILDNNKFAISSASQRAAEGAAASALDAAAESAPRSSRIRGAVAPSAHTPAQPLGADKGSKGKHGPQGEAPK